jgi:hypothetical protein
MNAPTPTNDANKYECISGRPTTWTHHLRVQPFSIQRTKSSGHSSRGPCGKAAKVAEHATYWRFTVAAGSAVLRNACMSAAALRVVSHCAAPCV